MKLVKVTTLRQGRQGHQWQSKQSKAVFLMKICFWTHKNWSSERPLPLFNLLLMIINQISGLVKFFRGNGKISNTTLKSQN
jgi:hypothetical protein